MGGRGREASEAPPRPRSANQLQAGLQGKGGAGKFWFFYGQLGKKKRCLFDQNCSIFSLFPQNKRIPIEGFGGNGLIYGGAPRLTGGWLRRWWKRTSLLKTSWQ